ncbi:MAG: protein translocase subunit SecF [Acidimicrobiia bacterium]|nr:protein translocase subunit SecF [Acidimicrobiia bacterium]
MSILGRLYRGDIHFDFVGRRRLWAIISGTAVVIAILSLLIRQFNLSVDFEGGTVVEVPNIAAASLEDARSAVGDAGFAGARVQVVESDVDKLRVQTEALPGAEQDRLITVLVGVAGATFDDAFLEAVGPTFGAQITERAIRALVIFLIVVTLFITFRFEWKMALAALAALFHDLFITAGIYSLVGFEVTPATVIAVLTILGYSLYDTVVVFDKVQENIEEHGDRHTFPELANFSMNQVLMRSINTSLTSLLPIGSLLFIGSYLLGASTLREFALALFIGVAAGTYSSIFVATPLLAWWKEREPEWERMQRRHDRAAKLTGSDAPLEAVPDVSLPAPVARPPKRRKRR